MWWFVKKRQVRGEVFDKNNIPHIVFWHVIWGIFFFVQRCVSLSAPGPALCRLIHTPMEGDNCWKWMCKVTTFYNFYVLDVISSLTWIGRGYSERLISYKAVWLPTYSVGYFSRCVPARYFLLLLFFISITYLIPTRAIHVFHTHVSLRNCLLCVKCYSISIFFDASRNETLNLAGLI